MDFLMCLKRKLKESGMEVWYKVTNCGSRWLHAKGRKVSWKENGKEVHTCHCSWCALRNGCWRWGDVLYNVLNRRWWLGRCFWSARENSLCAFVASVTNDDRCLNFSCSTWPLRQRWFFIVGRHFEKVISSGFYELKARLGMKFFSRILGLNLVQTHKKAGGGFIQQRKVNFSDHKYLKMNKMI